MCVGWNGHEEACGSSLHLSRRYRLYRFVINLIAWSDLEMQTAVPVLLLGNLSNDDRFNFKWFAAVFWFNRPSGTVLKQNA